MRALVEAKTVSSKEPTAPGCSDRFALGETVASFEGELAAVLSLLSARLDMVGQEGENYAVRVQLLAPKPLSKRPWLVTETASYRVMARTVEEAEEVWLANPDQRQDAVLVEVVGRQIMKPPTGSSDPNEGDAE